VQTRRYVSGLDAPQAPGGPTAPISAPKIDETLIGDMWRYLFGSQISVEDATVEADKRVSIIIDPAGAAAASFTLNFDSSVLRGAIVELIDDGPEPSTLTVNYSEVADGELGILVDAAERAGKIRVTFDVVADSDRKETEIGFSNSIATCSASDSFGQAIPVRFNGGSVLIK
ncbi:MAG: hypothetical protein KBF83_06555, partial [Pyrinomonadaceae bacterium]|nr:hypothetical protein [Pyrinomonadaceae bacterium]